MKRSTAFYLSLAAVVLVAITYMVAQRGMDGAPAISNEIQVNVAGGIVTLYAMDPLLQNFCFADGGEGLVFSNNEVRNRCSDISFNYQPESLSVGMEGARLGNIIDLGDARELARRYDYAETVSYGQGFASLRIQGGKMVVLKDRESQAVQDLKESALLFQEGKGAASVPVKVGHIYLARISDHYDKNFQRLVKFVVIAYTPKESVTIRWRKL